MNRFVKDNLLFIVLMGSASIGVLVFLLFSVFSHIEMGKKISNIEKLRTEIGKLVAQKPAPVEGNKEPIKKDIAAYKKALVGYREVFYRPMDIAAADFIKTLRLVNPERDEDGNIQFLTREKFVDSFNEMWNQSGEGNYAQKNFAFRTFRRRFANWNKALETFVNRAKLITTEPITGENVEAAEELLLDTLGIPRRMENNPIKMERFMRNYQATLAKMMSDLKFDNTVAWFGFNPDPQEIAKSFTNPSEQYPQIAHAWDMIGDVIKMVSEVKPEFFNGLKFRNAPGGSNEIPAVQGIKGEAVGSFICYRFRLEVAGNLDSIRKLVKKMDESFKHHRFYLIRSIALYAVNDGANEIFIKADEMANAELATEETAPVEEEQVRPRGRRGRRGSYRQAEIQRKNIDAERLQKEKEKKAELDKLREENKKKYKYWERIGYGQVLVGNFNTCRAVIDFDYIVQQR